MGLPFALSLSKGDGDGFQSLLFNLLQGISAAARCYAEDLHQPVPLTRGTHYGDG